MRRIFAVMMLGAALTATAADTKSTKDKKQTRSRQENRAATLTGCVDQRGTMYVLTGEGSMQASSTLQGRAFNNDNFARFVGHKVKVTGESKDGVFHVDKIDKVAETCH